MAKEKTKEHTAVVTPAPDDFEQWKMTPKQAMGVLMQYLDRQPRTPALVHRALNTLWEEAAGQEAEQPVDTQGRCFR